MKEKTLLEAFQYVDDRYLDEAAFTPARQKPARRRYRRLLTLAAAAVLLLALGAAASASGRLPFFGTLKKLSADPAEQAYYEKAEEAAAGQQAEVLSVQGFDLSALTVYEQYYDGENLLLGFRLDGAVPTPSVGYEPSTEQLERMISIPGSYAFTYSEDPDDSLDHQLARFSREDDVQYGISQEEYDQWMEGRSENAKEADLRNENNIMMDLRLKERLSPEAYDSFWKLLREKGHACAVFHSLVPGDHVRLLDGTELGAPGWTEVEGGSCLEIRPVAETARDRDSLDLCFTVYGYTQYWYMEMDGHAYILYDRDEGTELTFTVDRNA